MVHEYQKLSQTFEEIKAENGCLNNSSVEPCTAQLGETDSLQTELSKLHDTQKSLNDKSGLGFSFGESSSEGTCTQSDLAGDKFKKMNFVKASTIHDAYESVKYVDQTTGKLNHKGKTGIGYIKAKNRKPSWLTNRIEKDKAKVVPKSSVLNQQRRGSMKAKSVWIKVQPKRDLKGQNTKPKLNRSHKISARTLVDIHTGKTVKVAQRAKLIRNNAKINEDASVDVIALQRQIQKLKDQLSFLMKHQHASLDLPDFAQDSEKSSLGYFPGRFVTFDETNLYGEHKIPRGGLRKMKNLEDTLTGVLHQKKLTEMEVKRLRAEIERMNLLVHQQEEKARQKKNLGISSEFNNEKREILRSDLFMKEEGENKKMNVKEVSDAVHKVLEITGVEAVNICSAIETVDDFSN
ncbi:phragmoplast orienting kinesin-1-like [Dorcoceras hygrometricum]|uniref:Phragmoplast orienting kinesin-1-like n=1 Tax=Dorcoceras hygrometricum TaxID=472368 RepID=A0A2Z7ANB3_9LAMI|nr:phragmoplast orienting kinesin-1-like [Dorcoceras hygrometricum]